MHLKFYLRSSSSCTPFLPTNVNTIHWHSIECVSDRVNMDRAPLEDQAVCPSLALGEAEVECHADCLIEPSDHQRYYVPPARAPRGDPEPHLPRDSRSTEAHPCEPEKLPATEPATHMLPDTE